MATVHLAANFVDHHAQRSALKQIIAAYDSPVVRAYCHARFGIININMLNILTLCMRGQTRFIEVGCGFGLFACYFASRWPRASYRGFDIDGHRIEMARTAASHLGLSNVRFDRGDAASPLPDDEQYDAVVMMDLVHHLPDGAKHRLLSRAVEVLEPGGRLIIKDVTRKPAWKMGFTWALDVLMTRGFDMWYWSPQQFRDAVDPTLRLETYPIADLLPYPHIVYVFTKPTGIDSAAA